MKKSKIISFSMLLGAIILQAFAFLNASNIYYENGFVIGISNQSKNYDVAVSLIYVIIPVAFILFFFSGTTSDLTRGYGKLLIIRNYSKSKLLLKRLLKNCVVLLLTVLLQCAIFIPFNSFLNKIEHGISCSIALYFIILHAIILLQCLLELYISAQNANIFLLVYCFISYYIVQISGDNFFKKILLFPSLMFGMQNGATDKNNIYYLYLATGILLNILFAFVCVRKFKRTDIF